MNERLDAIVSGRVQLVMYRDFAQRKARGLRLSGCVRNLEDGTVHVIAEGPRAPLERYLAKLRTGPLLARVEGVAPTWLPATGEYEGFQIVYG
ncbi:MAG: acylphosphatase [Sphingobium sp.]